MRGLLKTSSTFGFACLGALLGAGAFVLVANWGGSKPPVNPVLSPADVVASRFPFDWNEATASPAPAAVVKASYSGVAGQQALLSPRPTYQLASATVDHLPAMAYAPETTTVVPRVDRAPAAYAAPTKPAPEAKATPAKPAAAASNRESRQVLNSAQIASIKKRLSLTREQEQYWPAVEAALRQMAWKKTSGDKKGEAKVVDMSTVDVDGLKSAAFPLVMSFSDDQKRELRSLAHLLGLESVASRF
jgi:hypothetical protein